MHHFISPEDSFRVEHAINFLVTRYAESGHNPKPVVLHSIRIAIYLMELGYEADIVMAAVLHDLIEDTKTTRDDIEKEFGKEIADMVNTVSFRTEIYDPVAQYKEMFQRVIASGRKAVAIKAADIHCNSIYIQLVSDRAKQEFLVEKMKAFVDMSEDFNDEIVVKNLLQRYKEERGRLDNQP